MCESNEEIMEAIIDVVNIAVESSDLRDELDVGIVLGLLECCETVANMPKKRKRKEWIKPWRRQRENRGSFCMLMRELSSDVSSFFSYIRMDENTFKYILNGIESDITKQNTIMRQSIPADEKLAATLRFLATGETYASTNYQTRLSDSFLSNAVPQVCAAIWNKYKGEYLRFPTTKSEWELIADQFAIKWQFPLCLGALDGKHIEFQPKRKDGSFYYNYKGTNSIVLMALVDADCRFIYIDVGCNGRCHDAGVLAQCDLKDVLDDAEKHFPADKIIGNGRKLPYVVVGDDAFPLRKHIMKPYSYRSMAKERQIFNLRLSRARHVVEHAFGILSNRFRIFQHRINLKVETVELVTKTCCVLHNFLCKKSPSYMQSSPESMPEHTETISATTDHNRKCAAEDVRQGFQDYFNNEGKVDWQDSRI